MASTFTKSKQNMKLSKSERGYDDLYKQYMNKLVFLVLEKVK